MARQPALAAVCLLALACLVPAHATKCYDADSFMAAVAVVPKTVEEACVPFENGVPACRAACRDYVIAEKFPTCDASGSAMRTCKKTCTNFASACGVPDVMCFALGNDECSAGAPTPKAKFEENVKVMRQLLTHDMMSGSGSGSGMGITLTVDGEDMDMAGFMYGVVFPIIYSDVYSCRPDLAGAPMDDILASDEFSDHIQNFVLSNYMEFSTADASDYLLCHTFNCTDACMDDVPARPSGGLPEADECAPPGVGGLSALTACPDEALVIYGADYLGRCPLFYFSDTSDLYGMKEYTNETSGETEEMEDGYWIVEPSNMRGTLTSEMVSVPLRLTMLQSYLDTYDPDYMLICVYDRCYDLDRCALDYLLTLDPTGMMLQTPSLVGGMSGKLYQYAKFIPTENPPPGSGGVDARRLLQEMGFNPRATTRSLLADPLVVTDTVVSGGAVDTPTSGGNNYNVKGYQVNVGPPPPSTGGGSGSGRRRSLLAMGSGAGNNYNPCDDYNSDNTSRRRLLAHFADNHRSSEASRAEYRRQLLEVDAAIAAAAEAAKGFSASATSRRHHRHRSLLGLDEMATLDPHCDSVCQFLEAYFGRVANARPDLTPEGIRDLLEERHADVALEAAIREYQESGHGGGIEAALEYAVPALDELLGLTGPESRARLLVENSPSDADHYGSGSSSMNDGGGDGDPWGSGASEEDMLSVKQDPPFNYVYEEGAGSKYSTSTTTTTRRRALLFHRSEETRRRLLSDECDATDPDTPPIMQSVNLAGVQCFSNTIYTDKETKTCGVRGAGSNGTGDGAGSGASSRRRSLLAAGPDKVPFPEFLRVLRAGRAFSNDENAVVRGRRLLTHDDFMGSGFGSGADDERIEPELDVSTGECTVPDDPDLTCATTYVPQDCGSNYIDTYVTNGIGETTIIQLKSCYCGDECTYAECYPADGSCREYEPVP